jgi:acetyl esterase
LRLAYPTAFAEGNVMSEDYFRPDVRAFLDWVNGSPGPRTHEVDAPTARAMFQAMAAAADVAAGPIALRRDLAIEADGRTIGARFYDPRATREGPGPLLVFYHGGGFVLGDLDTHDAACVDIATALDLPLLSIDYRLAPEQGWPAAPDDCEAATRWAAAQPDLFDRRFDSLALAGDSAGGNLAIVTAMALRDAPAALPVIATWPIYPAADLRKRYPSTDRFGQGHMLTIENLLWFNEQYAPDFTHWRASPGVNPLQGMPPTLIVTASLDPLLDQGRAHAAACIAAGVPTIYREAKGNIHGWLTLRKAIPSSEQDLRLCLGLLRQMIEDYRP